MDWLSVLICPWEAGTIRFQFPRSLMYRSLYSSRNPTISFNLIHILDCICERRKRNVNKFIFPRYSVSFLSIFSSVSFLLRFFDSFFLFANFFCEIRWKNFTSYSLLASRSYLSFIYLFWFVYFFHDNCEAKFSQFYPIINFNPSVGTKKATSFAIFWRNGG